MGSIDGPAVSSSGWSGPIPARSRPSVSGARVRLLDPHPLRQLRGDALPVLGFLPGQPQVFHDFVGWHRGEPVGLVQQRMGGTEPVVSVPEGLKSAVFPSMMLQTLVENAIKHGLEPKPEGGRLEIGAEIVDGQLAVHVRDTGIGFMPKAEAGVGLANVRERHLRHYQSALRSRPGHTASVIERQHAPLIYLRRPDRRHCRR